MNIKGKKNTKNKTTDGIFHPQTNRPNITRQRIFLSKMKDFPGKQTESNILKIKIKTEEETEKIHT